MGVQYYRECEFIQSIRALEKQSEKKKRSVMLRDIVGFGNMKDINECKR